MHRLSRKSKVNLFPIVKDPNAVASETDRYQIRYFEVGVCFGTTVPYDASTRQLGNTSLGVQIVPSHWEMFGICRNDIPPHAEH